MTRLLTLLCLLISACTPTILEPELCLSVKDSLKNQTIEFSGRLKFCYIPNPDLPIAHGQDATAIIIFNDENSLNFQLISDDAVFSIDSVYQFTYDCCVCSDSPNASEGEVEVEFYQFNNKIGYYSLLDSIMIINQIDIALPTNLQNSDSCTPNGKGDAIVTVTPI